MTETRASILQDLESLRVQDIGNIPGAIRHRALTNPEDYYRYVDRFGPDGVKIFFETIFMLLHWNEENGSPATTSTTAETNGPVTPTTITAARLEAANKDPTAPSSTPHPGTNETKKTELMASNIQNQLSRSVLWRTFGAYQSAEGWSGSLIDILEQDGSTGPDGEG